MHRDIKTANTMWTGTDSDGSSHNFNCNNWNPTQMSTTGQGGFVNTTLPLWLVGGWEPCTSFSRGLYCVSQ